MTRTPRIPPTPEARLPWAAVLRPFETVCSLSLLEALLDRMERRT